MSTFHAGVDHFPATVHGADYLPAFTELIISQLPSTELIISRTDSDAYGIHHFAGKP